MSKPTTSKNTLISLGVLGVGLFLIVGLLSALDYVTEQPWLMVATGSTGLLLFAYPSSPFSQSKNVLGGHAITSIIGLLCLHLLGPAWWSLALATAVGAIVMIHLNVVHPPAAGTAFFIFHSTSSWTFILFPMLFASVTLIVTAKIYWILYRRFL